MTRTLTTAVAALALLVAAAPANAEAHHRADGKLSDWRGKPTYIAGDAIVSRGEYVYTDWLFDDYGPNLDGVQNTPAFRSSIAPTEGDYRYPADSRRYGFNAADLRELRVAADTHALHFLIGLETMKATDAAIATIALDGDRSASTSMPWPRRAGLESRGAERFVTTWGSGARVTTPGGTHPVRTRVNLKENAIEVDVPYRLLDGALAERPKIWVAVGLNDGGRFAQQAAGETAAFNVGFRDETYPRFQSNWNDHEQSNVLAGGDITRWAGAFDLDRLLRRNSDRRRPPGPGYHTRIFRSKMKLGEGIDLKQEVNAENGTGGGPKPEFLSQWQEYALYVPKGYRRSRPNPLTLTLHSLDVTLTQWAVTSPHVLTQIGDERGSVLVSPLARGTDTWFFDSALVDTLEAWADARRLLAIDDDRTSIFGYSMGGYGTYRIALLMPDRFARASVYSAPPAYQLWAFPSNPVGLPLSAVATGNTNRIVDNARNLPYEIVHGTGDQTVPPSGPQQQFDTFQAKGEDVRFYRHDGASHVSFSIADEWAHTRDFLGGHARRRNPVEVVYRRFPSSDLPRRGLRFDSAYWVSRIRVRDGDDPSDSGLVEASTSGLGGRRLHPEMEPAEPVSGPVAPGTKFEQRRVPGDAIDERNAFRAQLTNVSAVTFDARRMGLTSHRQIDAHLETDGAARITLLGRFRDVAAQTAAGELAVERVSGGIRFTVPAGVTDVTVAPR